MSRTPSYDGEQHKAAKIASPIFVTGMPRSGTTFLQQLLSSHPEITIFGQEPKSVCWGEWLQTLLDGVAFARRSNEEFPAMPPHYACGCDEATTAELFLRFLQRYLVGEMPTRRWGIKSLGDCRVVPEAIRTVWPETRWVVCLRDPFRAMESLRNTFDTDGVIPWCQLCDWWSDAAEFAHQQSDARPVFLDRLETAESRRSMVAKLFAFLGEEPTEKVWEFVGEWPVIHKFVPDEQRTYCLDESRRSAVLREHPRFAHWVEALGYLESHVSKGRSAQ